VRAAILSDAPPRLETTVVDDPAPGRGQVVVRVSGCGICGSDLHIAARIGAPGTILGHEIAGVIEGTGPDVEARWECGTAVTARPFSSCGTCRWCREERPDHCASFHLLGFTRPGGFAERVILSSHELFALPAALSGPEQALVEPLAVARHGLRRAGLVPGAPILVLGAGPIGLATTAWARSLGASSIAVSDPVPARRELARRLGADAVLDPGAGELAGPCTAALGDAPDLVMECTGRPGLVGQAMELVAVNGRVGVVGACMARDTYVPWNGLHKELDVRFALYYDRVDFSDTIDALASGRLAVDGLVTDVIALEDLPAVFAALAANADGGKVVVAP
jgi:(R,R)-butanediol dehydrogenase / meso-butanediol dehydrogenase / diacetyl reductase